MARAFHVAPASLRDGRSSAQSLVEFTLVLPILLLIVLGALDLGRAYVMTISMQSAVKEGAMYGARNPVCDTPAADSACADPSNVAARVTRELGAIGSPVITSRCYVPATADFSGSGKSLATCSDGDLYRVSVTATFSLITPVISFLVGNSFSLSADATSVVITSFSTSGSPIDPGS
ncbi:MAG: TadE/TadG family type IV pilus assembly protein, partial [Chloroflexota bacterium]